jgi:hypothetical protein
MTIRGLKGMVGQGRRLKVKETRGAMMSTSSGTMRPVRPTKTRRVCP